MRSQGWGFSASTTDSARKRHEPAIAGVERGIPGLLHVFIVGEDGGGKQIVWEGTGRLKAEGVPFVQRCVFPLFSPCAPNQQFARCAP